MEIPKGVKPKPIGDRRSAYAQVNGGKQITSEENDDFDE